MPHHPNILFLFSDQHNARCLGCAGHPDVKTPNLDRLAAEGVRFERAFAQNPICTPSRMCFLSGLYAHNHGYYGLEGPNPAWLPSAFSLFKAHGYHTGAIGKIHTPAGWIEPHCDCVRDVYDGNRDYQKYLEALGLADKRDDEVLAEWRKVSPRGQGIDARPSTMPLEHSPERYCSDEAMCFIRQRPTDKPFFLWLSFPRPHECYTPSREFWEMYDEQKLTLPPSADDPLTDKPPHVREMLHKRKPGAKMWLFEPRNWEQGRRRVLRGYLGCVTQVDEALGRVLGTLRELGLERDTIVVYSCDHGDFAGEHGIIEKAPGLSYDAITRIPFLWRWPGHLKAGHVTKQLAESIDVFPTLCQLIGLPAPALCDGRDLRPILTGGDTPIRDAAFTETPWGKRIRTQEWSLVHFPRQMFPESQKPVPILGTGFSGGVGELYDMANDPWELRNLYHDPTHRDRREQLTRQLFDWLVTTTHTMTMLPSLSPQTGSQVAPEKLLAEDGRLHPAAMRYLAERKSRAYL